MKRKACTRRTRAVQLTMVVGCGVVVELRGGCAGVCVCDVGYSVLGDAGIVRSRKFESTECVVCVGRQPHSVQITERLEDSARGAAASGFSKGCF